MHTGPKTFYKSKLVGKLSSKAMAELKKKLREASQQRKELTDRLRTQQNQLKSLERKRKWLGWSPLSKLYEDKVSDWEAGIVKNKSEVEETEQALQRCKVGIEIELADNVEAGFGALYHAYTEVQQSDMIWDITTSQRVDRIAQRTVANRSVERKTVEFGKASLDIVSCDYESLHLHNANGEDLYIYPLFIVMRDEKELALIDLMDVELRHSQSAFVEDETVPEDAELIDYTWAKANKDGSRDKRYKNNYQIPVMRYGQIHFKTEQGLNEVYMVSDADALLEFANIFDDYQKLLAST